MAKKEALEVTETQSIKPKDSLEVETAFLQGPIQWGGNIQMEHNLYSTKLPKVKMFISKEGHKDLWLESQGKTAVMPSANAKLFVLK